VIKNYIQNIHKEKKQMKGRKTALITGASEGIGFELTRLFAKDGYDLILAARNKKKMDKMAKDLSVKFGINVKVLPKDLSRPGSAGELYKSVLKVSKGIDVLVNNAGFNVFGNFTETDLQTELDMINVNLISLTVLTKHIAKDMAAAGGGRILNLGSVVSHLPTPRIAVYAATKAYVLHFSDAIAEELKGSGVTVTTLCPGQTATNFAPRSGMENSLAFSFGVMSPESVAKIGYRALMKGKRHVAAGILAKLAVFWTTFFSGRIKAKFGKLLTYER
jgi:uncharacterized protein